MKTIKNATLTVNDTKWVITRLRGDWYNVSYSPRTLVKAMNLHSCLQHIYNYHKLETPLTEEDLQDVKH